MMKILIHEIKTALFPRKPSLIESLVLISCFRIYTETIHVYMCVSQVTNPNTAECIGLVYNGQSSWSISLKISNLAIVCPSDGSLRQPK